MIGQTISHYKILEKLGEGGMGVVYKAEDTTLRRTVALKFLPPEMTRSAEAKARLLHEAQAAAALDHPNICTIHEIGEADGKAFIAMSLVEGESLSSMIRNGPLRLDQAIDLALQIAEGLAAAHAVGVVHRDMKPGNVMVTADGRARIMDFGLAWAPEQTRLTRPGITTGTIAYMSPEQGRGEGVDHRTDIWSFGVMLYEMITGQRPFKGNREQAIIYSILNDEPEPITGLRTGVPVELERIIAKAMAKRLGERYQTTADLLADLHHVQRGLKEEVRTGRTMVLPAPVKQRPLRWPWVISLVAVVTVVAWIVTVRLAPSGRTPAPNRKMLAVLPFENLGDAEDDYFADGITEEITARLAGIQGLGVIARTSAVKYKNAEKTIRQIGDELDVDYVLEGTVRWQRGTDVVSQVRVTPQLIRVTDESHIWADIYQEDIRDVFRVQSGIAEQVARALDVKLLEPERSSLQTKPTKSLEAYQAYLRALEREPLGYGYEDLVLMEKMLSRAIDLDPEFALAHALLSRTHSRFYIFSHDRSPERLVKARAAADRALELAPELPEGHLALGVYYYSGFRDYEKALAELEIAERARPSDTDVLFLKGVIYKRQARFDDALEVYASAAELDPLDAQLADEIGIVYRLMRRYPEAERYFSRAISLAPDQTEGYGQKANLYRVWHGDLGMARDVLEEMPPTHSDEWFAEWNDQEYFERDFKAALDWLGQRKKKPDRHVVDVAFLNHLMGREERALALYDSARAELEITSVTRPEDPSVHRALADAYSGLGRKEEAVREIQLAMETPELSGDIPQRYEALETLAAIYAESAEYDVAVEQLEYLLARRSRITVPLLRLDPKWDPLREYDGFKRLLEKYASAAR